MTRYRIVLLAETGRTLGSGQAFSPDEARMRAQAEHLLASRPDCAAVEVWDGSRLLVRLARPSTAAAG